jgi:hypothetical protein
MLSWVFKGSLTVEGSDGQVALASLVSGHICDQPHENLFILTLAHKFNGRSESEYGLYKGDRLWTRFSSSAIPLNPERDGICIPLGKIESLRLRLLLSQGKLK